MKNLLLLLLLPAVLVAGVIGNAIYIKEVSNHITAGATALPPPTDPTCREQVAALVAYWERQRTAVGLTASSLLTDRVSEQLAMLSACANAADPYGFAGAQALLCNAAEGLRRRECFSPACFW